MEELVRAQVSKPGFEQMCNFAAVSTVRDHGDALKQLVLRCFVILPEEKLNNANQLSEAIEVLFGLRFPDHQVESAIDSLLRDRALSRPVGTNLVMKTELLQEQEAAIHTASELESHVKDEWLQDVAQSLPTLPSDQIWKALRAYLALAFRRHGMQAIALLDPGVSVGTEHSESLSSLLNEALMIDVEPEYHADARIAISSFLAEAGKHPERTRYIAELGDGAFNYFSLTVDPNVAKEFRERVSQLTLFLDTNFLFGILDLHVNPHVQVSNDLLRAVTDYKLPFELRYHEATAREMQATIDYYGGVLRSRHWSQSLSRAAVRSRCVSGIEMKYHERNAIAPIEPEMFLKPYDHLDVLLSDQNIHKYDPDNLRLYERSDLLDRYGEFIKNHNREKPYESLEHDATVLDTARTLRSSASSSLEAGALLITCDYMLFRFDWETCRAEKRYACTVLPNIFWQIIRPFIPSDSSFDKSFAETFAIPEFRTIGSGATKACSKMMCILAGYDNLSEETAARLLTNDLLIDQLRTEHDQDQFAERVESAIAADNQALLEERAALARQIEEEREEKTAIEIELERERLRIAEAEKELVAEKKKREEERAEAERVIKDQVITFSSESQGLEKKVALSQEDTENERAARKEAEERAEGEAKQRKRAEQIAERYAIAAGLMLSLMVVTVFEWLVFHYNWEWLLAHTNSYGLQGGFALLITSVVLGIFCSRYRKGACYITVLSVVALLLQLVGGRR